VFAVHSCFHQIPDAAFAAVIDITAVYTLLDYFIEGFLKEIALLPFSCSGLAECGVIWDCVIQFKSAKPSVGDVELNFLHQPPL